MNTNASATGKSVGAAPSLPKRASSSAVWTAERKAGIRPKNRVPRKMPADRHRTSDSVFLLLPLVWPAKQPMQCEPAET